MTPWWVLVLAGIAGLVGGGYAGWTLGEVYSQRKKWKSDMRYLAQFERPCRILNDFASSRGSQEYCSTHDRLLSGCDPKTRTHLAWPYNGQARR